MKGIFPIEVPFGRKSKEFRVIEQKQSRCESQGLSAQIYRTVTVVVKNLQENAGKKC